MAQDSLGRMVEKPRYGGTLTLLPYRDQGNFDPVTVSPMTNVAGGLTHEDLAEADWARGPSGTGEYSAIFSMQPFTFHTGLLAESWEIPDDQTIIFHIRKGVHFALDPNSEASRLVGGREMTADDVVFSINRRFEDIPGSHARPRLQPYEWPVSVTALDKYTVEIKTTPGYVDVNMSVTGDWTKITAFEVVKKYGVLREWNTSVGTGPFMLVDYVPGSSATFVKNPNYWAADPFFPENKLPYLDGVKFLYLKDMSTIIAGARTGKLDLTYATNLISRDDMLSLKNSRPEMKFREILNFSGIPTLFFMMNNPELPWYDQKVRQALGMAIDREAVKSDYYAGSAEILAAPTYPAPDWASMYTPLNELPQSVQDYYTYQPEKARKMLAEAGYPNGFTIQVDTSVLYDVDLLSVVKFYWEQVGVNLEIKVHEDKVFTSMTAETGATVPQAYWSRYGNWTPYSFHYWTQPDSAQLIEDEEAFRVREIVMKDFILNEPAIWSPLKEFHSYVMEKAWQVWLPAPYQYQLWQPWVKGYSGETVTGRSDYGNFIKHVWYDQALKKSLGY